MLLYTTYQTPRLQYVIGFISEELFDEPLETTTRKEAFLLKDGFRLNYSETEFSEDEFYLRPVSLLFENDIRPRTIDCFELNYHKVFFETAGDLPFDIFAACFYLLSRYEEYLPHAKDEYGRFSHTASLAFREGFLHMPLVNIWLQEFRKALQKKFPAMAFRHRSFKFIPTYDIDMAYSFLHKGWKRNLGGLLGSVLKGKWTAASQRIQVLRGRKKDPFDAYEWLDSLHLYCRMKACYFFLVAAGKSRYDKNIDPEKKVMTDLIRYHAAGYRVGVHPSWQSGDDPALLSAEIARMAGLTGNKILMSRQHYIRFDLPDTYRRLLSSGIEQDFSMGYGTINGFRASVASSFYWYDLEKEEQTSLRLFPFCFMDANAYYEQKYTHVQAMIELMQYYHAIKKVNGLMVTIWHNSFLGSDPAFDDWKKLYEIFLKEEVYWDV
ncbi:MAG: polysaccharide deacetylase family protein [Puia sp.]|nr:polysaccharide deacetylase family protein [Puia sp.]